VGATSTLLLGGPGAALFSGYSHGPLYRMPPATGPFSATAFLRGLSPHPTVVAAMTAPSLRPCRTPRPRQPPPRRACVWLPSPGSTSVPQLTLLLARLPRRSTSSTPLRGSASHLLSNLRLRLYPCRVLDPRVAQTTPWSSTSTFRPPGSRTSRT
jgi:hypothetical protein